MPVAVILDFENASTEQYDQVMENMGLQDGSSPPGALFHWVTSSNGGLRVVDVWESREVFDRFAEEQIGPYTQEVGIEEQPQITFYDVHNYVPR